MRRILGGAAVLALLVPAGLHAAAIPWMPPPPATGPRDLPAWIAFTLLGVVAEGVRS